jgi:hypothetical protein
MDVSEGAVIAGRYVVERQLGAGGMGVVVLARDTRLKRAVAVKVLPPQLLSNAGMRERLLREATAAAQLRHPGIVHVYDVGETEEGGAYLVMEVVPGQSLGDALRARSLTRARILELLREAAAALEYAHGMGMVHRDVKPDNVMVREDGHAVLLDFGLAKTVADASASLTATGGMVGTPAYVAPEQALGEAVDARADQYALATMAFEALTGSLPWSATSALAMVVEKVNGTRLVASELSSELPKAVDGIFERALSRDPAARFPTVMAFVEALGSVPGVAVDERPSKTIGMALASTVASDPTAAPIPVVRDAEVRESAAARLRTTGASMRPPSGRAPGRSRLAAAGIAGGVVLLALAFGGRALLSRSASPRASASPSAPSPLTEAGSVVACPQLEASGVEAPSGWLGAAAAAQVCERARIVFAGGRTERTLAPAELLDLPTDPSVFPADPYGATDARTRALTAAHARAAAYVDGTVQAHAHLFTIELVLRSRDDRELARGRGEAPSVLGAVRRAMEPLLSDAAMPLTRQLDPELAPWDGPSVDAALAAVDLAMLTYTPDFAGECEALVARLVVPERVAMARFICPFVRGLPAPPPEPSKIDDSSSARLAETARVALALDPHVDARALAARIEGALATEKTARGRAQLAAIASCARQAAGDTENALDLAIRATQASARPSLGEDCTEFSQVAVLTNGSASAIGAARAYAAWEPFIPAAPRSLTLPGTHEWLVAARRANLLAPYHVTIAEDLAVALLHEDQRQEARAVAVMLTDGALHHLAASLILARVDASEAQFDAALGRLRRELGSASGGGYINTELLELWLFARDLAVLLGRQRELADGFSADFVDLGRPAIETWDGTAVTSAASICLYASRASAGRCFAKLHDVLRSTPAQQLPPGAAALLGGAEAFARGDMATAAGLWRPLTRGLAHEAGLLGDALPTALRGAGDADLANRLDAPALDGHGPFNGVSLATVRAATDANGHGDHEAARRLAQSVVNAWSMADVAPPTLAPMRALLGH